MIKLSTPSTLVVTCVNNCLAINLHIDTCVTNFIRDENNILLIAMASFVALSHVNSPCDLFGDLEKRAFLHFEQKCDALKANV